MTNFKPYRSKPFLFALMLFVSLTCFSSFGLNGSELKDDADLNIYEKKSLFIFPLVYNNNISSSILTNEKKDFLVRQMYKMFVIDFGRIDFYEIRSDESVDTFLQDAHAYLLKNIQQITRKRLQPDYKFKEEMLTDEELLKTSENSYALVPVFDSIEKEAIQGKDSTSYVYNMYAHFDIYNTKTKEKISTLKINNKKNWLGSLASVTGSMEVDNSDIEGLPENEKADEKSFRSSTAGLLVVLKKQMKEMPEFRIKAALSMVDHSMFGFDLGKDTGIKIDHRYKTYVTKADGKQKMTGFGKIRKVETSFSKAQILIGKPTEGDQVVEDPKVGINIVGGFGTMPLHIAFDNDFVAGSHKCVFLGVEYELGPAMGQSEWYTALNLRIGLPTPEEFYTDDYNVSQILLTVGVVKKIYLRRVGINFGGFVGYHAASIKNKYSDDEWQGGSVGFTMSSGIEILVTPSISAFGGLNLDFYSNPSKLKVNNSYDMDFPEDGNWNSKGISVNFGIKFTL